MKAISVPDRDSENAAQIQCSLLAGLFGRLTLVLLLNAFCLPHSQTLLQSRSLTAAHTYCLIETQMVCSALFSSEKCAGLNGPGSPASVPAASAGRVLHQAPAGSDPPPPPPIPDPRFQLSTAHILEEGVGRVGRAPRVWLPPRIDNPPHQFSPHAKMAGITFCRACALKFECVKTEPRLLGRVPREFPLTQFLR